MGSDNVHPVPKPQTLPLITLMRLIYTDQTTAKIAEDCQKIQIEKLSIRKLRKMPKLPKIAESEPVFIRG
jgi:hypothetical protein